MAQQGGNRNGQTHQGNEHGEAARKGAVYRLQQQPVVADILVKPRLRRAEDSADAHRLTHASQRLIAEDTHQNGGTGSKERRNLH